MSLRPTQTVGVVFGNRSGEHEVSVISAHQVMAALEVAGFRVLPIYIAKNGSWYAGEPLNNLKVYKSENFDPANLEGVYRVSLSPDPTVRQLILHPDTKLGFLKKPPQLWADVFFPVMHGTFGEDGSLQGLFELADVPYVGCGVLASATTMDKVAAKRTVQTAAVPVLPWYSFSRSEWHAHRETIYAKLEALAPYPLFLKPVNLGSSIGVKRAKDRKELTEGIEVALTLDQAVIVEPALQDFYEINCSVFGPPAQSSVCEQPVSSAEVLSFDDKYRRGAKGSGKAGSKQGGAPSPNQGSPSQGMASLDRLIPAPIAPELTEQIQQYARTCFDTLGCTGVVRIDFLVDRNGNKVYFNELNPIPGSLAFYLWEASGMSFDTLVTKLVDLAFERHSFRKETMFSFQANLLG